MEVITHWAGNIVSYLVFLTVLTGLLPAHKYEKYIRLFAGCILLLIVLKPLTDGLRLEERLNYLFTSLSFENEAGELKSEMDEDKRADLIFQMQQILVDDAAVLIDGYYNSSMIYSKNVGNAHIHTADYYWLTTEITPAQ